MLIEEGTYSVEELTQSMTTGEKWSMLEILSEQLGVDYGITRDGFRNLNESEQKRFLCDALCVPSYHSNDTLREKLENIINAL